MVLGLVASLVVLLELFVPHTIGATDNGDGVRLTCQLQVVIAARGLVTIHYDSPNHLLPCHSRYVSSALIPLAAGKAVTRALGLPWALDLRIVGVLYALAFGVAMGALSLVLPGGALARGLTVSAVTVVAADISFVQFFISVYSEAAEFLGLLAVVVALLALWRRRPTSGLRLALVVVALLWLGTAKTEDAPLAILTAGAVVAFTSVTLGRRGSGRLVSRLLPALGLAVVTTVGGLTLAAEPPGFHAMHMYADVFYSMLRTSPDPASDLRALGQPTELARWAGTTYFQPHDARQDPNYAQFLKNMSFRKIADFYLRRPWRLEAPLSSAAQEVVQARDRVSNTPLGSGAPPTEDCRVCLVSSVGAVAARWGGTLVPVVWVLAMGTGALLLRRRREEEAWTALGKVLLLMPVLALAAMLVSVLGDGEMELVKHVLPATVLTWLVVPLTGLGWTGLRKQGAQTPTQPHRAQR